MLHDDISYYGIETGSKQTVTVRLVSDQRANLQRLRIALEPEMNPLDAEVLLPQVVEYSERVAPHRIVGSEQMRNLRKTQEEGKIWLIPPAFRVLMQNNLYAGGISSSANGYEMTVYLQDLPAVNPEDAIAGLKRRADRFGVKCEVVK